MADDTPQLPVAYNTDGQLTPLQDGPVSLYAVRSVLALQEGTSGKPHQLSRQEKSRLAASAKQFWIYEVVWIEDAEHGQCWQVYAVMPGKDGEPFRFSFFMGVHDATTGEFSAMHDLCMANAQVGPMILSLVEWKGGNPFYQLVPSGEYEDFGLPF